jgi:hypothetical protein
LTDFSPAVATPVSAARIASAPKSRDDRIGFLPDLNGVASPIIRPGSAPGSD